MMTRGDHLEKKYYPTVLKYLSQEQGCVTSSFDHRNKRVKFMSRGQGQLIVDVYGLRAGTDIRTQSVEGIAVEVKRRTSGTSLRYILQAAQYSRLAHRCYLAQPLDFSDKVKGEAARVGIGLLRIRGSKVELVSESKVFEPDPVAFAQFLNRSLCISQCAICECFRFRYGSASKKDKSGGGHWRTDDLTLSERKQNKLTFICDKCEKHWAGANEVSKLQRRLEQLEKRLKRLTASHKKLKAKV